MRAHRGVRIEVHDSGLRRGVANRFDVLDRMHTRELADLRCRRFVALEEARDP